MRHAFVKLMLVASAGTVFAWPDQDVRVYNTRGNEELEPRGAEMLVNMGFAGMGYCPRAFVNEPNDNRQGSLFQWVFAVGDAEVSIARATSTLEAYSSLESTFLDKVPALPSNAYHLTGRARHAVAHQFGTLRNAREKIGFCLTALVAIATGRPVLAGLPIDCDPAPCRVHIRRPAAASPLIREGAMGLNHLLIDRLPNPAGWPRGGDALDASSALAVFAQHWGVQAIVVKASVPVVFEEGKMHMRPGILVSFRGTTSFSAKHALHPGNNQPGQHHVVDDGSPEDIADGAAHHQWAMNLRTRLSNVLNGAFGGPDGFRTMDGISHEAALLVGLDVGIAPRHLPEIFEGGDRGVPGNVCDAVRRLSGGARGVPVFVTGHSKGGALSILGSFLLQLCLVKHNSPSRVTTILSVEGPRTGDAAWVRTFTGYMQHTAAELGHARFNVYRTVKRNDPVTEGPLPSSDHRHMPGLLMVPVVTALDVRSDEPTVRLPPVFVCDQTEDLAQIVEWDRSRPQRGRVYKAPLPPHSEWSEHGGECKIQSATRDREVLPANAIEGGRLDGVTCNLCIRGTRDSCVEADYKPNGSDNPLYPWSHALARALIAHPYFGPTYGLCPAHNSLLSTVDALIPKFQRESRPMSSAVAELLVEPGMEAEGLPPGASDERHEATSFRQRLAQEQAYAGLLRGNEHARKHQRFAVTTTD